MCSYCAEMISSVNLLQCIIKRPVRDACLCMGEAILPGSAPDPHFLFAIASQP